MARVYCKNKILQLQIYIYMTEATKDLKITKEEADKLIDSNKQLEN